MRARVPSGCHASPRSNATAAAARSTARCQGHTGYATTLAVAAASKVIAAVLTAQASRGAHAQRKETATAQPRLPCAGWLKPQCRSRFRDLSPQSTTSEGKSSAKVRHLDLLSAN